MIKLLPLKVAQDTNRCRYCGATIDKITPDNVLVLNYGEEYAHQKCIPVKDQGVLTLEAKIVECQMRIDEHNQRIASLEKDRQEILAKIDRIRQAQFDLLLEAAGVTSIPLFKC